MYKAFVACVSICIGIVLGFILPSNSLEITLASATHDDDKNLTIDHGNGTISLANNQQSMENDIYNSSGKAKNQSERAFIYINQRYKKPSYNRHLGFLGLMENEYIKKYRLSHSQEREIQHSDDPYHRMNKGYNLRHNVLVAEQRPVKETKQQLQLNLTETVTEKPLNTDEEPWTLEKPQEDDKLLVQYIKDALMDDMQLTNEESGHLGDCRYRECIALTENGIKYKEDCKCKTSSKLNNLHITNNKLEKQQNQTNTHTVDSAFYGHMFSKDLIANKKYFNSNLINGMNKTKLYLNGRM